MIAKQRCRINRYFNQFDFDQTGLLVYKLSAWHIFPKKSSSCLCGLRFWSFK